MPRLPHRSVSVRTRITAAVAALVAASLTVAGLLVWAIENQRLEEHTQEAVEQELGEFATLAADGVDPATGEPYPGVAALLREFFERNVPDTDELLVGWVEGRDVRYYSGQDADTLVTDPAFVSAVADVVATGDTSRLSLPGAGDLLLVAQPVTVDGGEQTGALVVVTRLDVTFSGLAETMRTYTLVSLVALLLVTAAAFALTGRLLAPLTSLRRTAEEVASSADLSTRLPERGNDDVTALTRTVNQMLARLEDAFAEQRRFLDDAGHELRTPLTVLRGHLELLDGSDPADVAETRALLLDEVDRMSRLVGDLILLAKSDRPDFLRPGPVDLARLSEDLLAKATGLGDRAWRLEAGAVGTVEADEQRLTQAVLQLASNAVRHTDPGGEICLGTAWRPDDGGRLRLWVRDTGPGVPEAERERIFERFARAPGQSAEHEGFGLGLSIVSAIAEAHDGQVTLDEEHPDAHPDARPRGALFTLEVAAPAISVEQHPAPTTQEVPWPAS
ncbi:sensor histidine kinase [Nocardioides bruguierae]|uniref:histidine kinase n=1 Tax=Nocardioides bruguierae TaxID=2945102 RepID=A0A9X2D5W5_9ACTN|nr:HAMP domain-containing sensor histidine kinase [Nocardioides bruguierae]MCM0619427.1 HAMP domain-containing histidine kinase [Nocardioides bruguierae]